MLSSRLRQRELRLARVMADHGDLLSAGVVLLFAMALAFGYVIANDWSLVQATPLPVMHDEFANLLGADTFLHGRLANSASPVWESFQTFHVLAQPSYASKYPPGNAALLAFGIRVAGSPIVGVWFAYAIGCALLTWAAQPFVGRRWALAGGLVTALMMASSYWVSSYWGGALAFAGGALLLGSVRRLWDNPSPWLGLSMAGGIAVLATTRPYEGFLLAGASVIALVWRGWRARDSGPYRMAAVPAAIALAMLGAFLLMLNERVTGSMVTLPYVEYDRQYGIPPAWVTAMPRPPQEASFEEMKRFLEWAYSPFTSQRSWDGLLLAVHKKIEKLANFFLPQGMWAILLVLPLCWGDRWIRGLTALASIAVIAILAVVWLHPHYAAPLVAPVAILYLASARQLSKLRTTSVRIGWFLVLAVAARWSTTGTTWYRNALNRSAPLHRPAWVTARDDMRRQLSRESPGGHLVVVRYEPRHNVHEEWVYNGAELQSTPVLFARDLGPARNAKLIMHFPGRKIWVAHVGSNPKEVTLEPFVLE